MGLFWKFTWGQQELLQSMTGSVDIRGLVNRANGLYKKKSLEEVIRETNYDEVRFAAKDRLSLINSLSRKELRQLKQQEKQQEARIEVEKQTREAAKTTPGTAAYYAEQGDIAACAACGPPAIPVLLQLYIRENQTGMDRIDAALLNFGPMAYESVQMFTHAVLEEYSSYASTIHSINFSLDSDRQKAAVIKGFAEKLQRLIKLCAQFGAPSAPYIPLFYNQVLTKVYSDPTSGFADMFDAVWVRRGAVAAAGKLSLQTFARSLVPFYVEALQDASRFVRWECIDILMKEDRNFILQNVDLQQGLMYAAEHEPDSVSTRKLKIKELRQK